MAEVYANGNDNGNGVLPTEKKIIAQIMFLAIKSTKA
jgi:hypothetical protein